MLLCRVVVFYGSYGWTDLSYFPLHTGMDSGYTPDGSWYTHGRDIGTVVFPHADLKIFLTASAEERASRRYKEMLAKGMQVDLKQLQSDIEARDKQDCERKIAPLCCAEDAIFLDSSNMSIQEVASQILTLVQEH